VHILLSASQSARFKQILETRIAELEHALATAKEKA